MGKYKLFKDRLFIYICFLYLTGIIFGLFLFRKGAYEPNLGESSFFRTFCANYWYIFLMWLFGYSLAGLIFNSVIIFFRGFLFGFLLAVLIRISLKKLITILAVELIVFIPGFFLLGYFSLLSSRGQFYNMFSRIPAKINNKFYINIMLIVTAIIIIYSLIIII